MRDTNTGEISLGRAEISPAWAYACQKGTWEITYYCGMQTLSKGSRIRIYPPFTFDNRHNSCVRWDTGAISVKSSSSSVQVIVREFDNLGENVISDTYNCLAIEVELTKGELLRGENITVVMGDPSGEAAVAQWLSGPDMPFPVTVALSDNDEFKLLADYPTIPVYGGETERLLAVVPSSVQMDEKFSLRIKAEDSHTNISSLYQSPVSIELPEGITGLTKTALSLTNGGKKSIPSYFPKQKGTFHIKIKDGNREVLSNPVSTEFTEKNKKIYWGEIHAHTELSDGIGSENRYYEFARDEAFLDFAAIADHGAGGEWWPCALEATRIYNEPGRFVTIPGYEAGWIGHCNVYSIDPELPFYSPGTQEGRKHLLPMIKEGKAILIPHHTNDPLVSHLKTFDWDNDAREKDLFHVVELCQMRGSFEKDKVGEDHVLFGGFGSSVQDALAKGYRLGFIGGTDNHCGRPGYPMYNNFQPGPNIGSGTSCDIKKPVLHRNWCGLTAIFAEELTREAIFSAMRTRQCYATTGARILVNFKVNNLTMGQEGKCKTPVKVTAKVAGTAPLTKIVIIKNNQDVYEKNCHNLIEEISWEDTNPGKEPWYYLRVTQQDGHMAWSSPIWLL